MSLPGCATRYGQLPAGYPLNWRDLSCAVLLLHALVLALRIKLSPRTLSLLPALIPRLHGLHDQAI